MSTVIVLCGGKGERLRSVVSDRPKVLADVGGVAFLGHVLERLVRDGATKIVLSTGYRAEMVAEYVTSRQDWGADILCVAEADPLGTGGAIRHAAKKAHVEGPFFALNGDTWFDGSLSALAQFHQKHGARFTVALVAVEDSSRYGQVRFDDESGKLLEFIEKREGSGPGWINAGLYHIEADVLEELPAGKACSLEREIFPKLIGHGLHALAFERASFLDIGMPEDLAQAASLLERFR
jgi:NDP-sugar pyrophosphorylase family protein